MSSRVEKLMQQGQAAHRAGQPEQARRCYEKILETEPAHLDARYLLGTLFAEQGRYAQAQRHLEAASRLAPGSPYVHNNLGNVLLISGQFDAAEQAFRSALRAAPEMPEPLINLGNLLVKKGALEEAIEVARRAIALRPDQAAAQVTLANALKDQGRVAEAMPHYRRAAELAVGNTVTQSNLLLAMNYDPGVSRADIRRAHCGWGDRFPAPGARPSPSGGDRLRVGYISPDFCRHPVGYLIEPVLAAHDRSQFEVFVYSDTATADGMTTRLRRHADHWRDLQGLGNDRAAALIAVDRLDVLVELAGHSAANRLAMLSRRLATVQASYLGYPATTGLPSIDFVITDRGLDPSEEDQVFYRETLWRLDRPCFCFRPDEEFPAVGPLPALGRGALTFGSFNALGKISGAVIDLWASVLQALPRATLLMQARAFSDPGSRRRVVDRFGERGVEPGRLETHGFSSLAEHLALFHRTDICLDTFPWNGHMTTLDSLWMGVPVLTLAGDRRAARMGASIMGELGLREFVASSPEDFVAKAVALAGRLDVLAELRASLRGRLESSALADGASLARALEGAFRAMRERVAGR